MKYLRGFTFSREFPHKRIILLGISEVDNICRGRSIFLSSFICKDNFFDPGDTNIAFDTFWVYPEAFRDFVIKNLLSLKIYWTLIFGNVILCSTLRLWVEYFVYFKSIPVFFNGCYLVQLQKYISY